jgi:creatinine amidohydrolase
VNVMQVKDQFDPVLRKIIKKRKQAAIIPIGSIEQHGPHLPVSTDSDIITEIAKRLSSRCNLLLLPTINYGISFEHAPFFNLSVKNSTMQRVLVDLGNSLVSNKIPTLFILNGHHGNQSALRNISKKIELASKRKIRVFVFSYWHFMKIKFDHAGFVETSLMRAISNKVNMKKSKKGLVTENMSKKQILRLSKLASKSFPKATKSGVWGDPTRATTKDGKKLLNEIVKNLEKACQTCLTDKNRKLHQ